MYWSRQYDGREGMTAIPEAASILTGDGDRELEGEGVCITPPLPSPISLSWAGEVGVGPGTSAYTSDSHCKDAAMALKAVRLTNMCSAG